MSLAIVGQPYIDYGPDPIEVPQPIFLSSTINMQVGDTIEIMLDDGTLFKTTIKRILASGQILINKPLPSRATAGNVLLNLTQSKNVLPDNEDFLT